LKKIHFLEIALTVITLLLTTGGPLLVILSGGISEGELGIPKEYDSTLVQYLFAVLYFLFFLLLLPHWKRALLLIAREKWVFALVLLAILSVSWTQAPELTPRRLYSLAGTTIVGIYLAVRYDFKQQMKLLAWAMAIAIVTSILFALLLPRYGVMGGLHIGDWRGIYLHKNVLGKIMTLSICIFTLLLREPQPKRRWLWTGLGFSWVLVLLTSSSSALVNSIALTLLVFILSIIGWRNKLLIPASSLLLLGAGGLSVWISSSTSAIFGLLGKDATLTGRTELWPAVSRMIGQHPLWGYGYSGFWNGRLSDAALVWRSVRWEVPHSHNGYLDLGLDLGLVGLALFLIGFSVALVRSLVWIRTVTTVDQIWPTTYLAYYTLSNLTESSLLAQNNVAWIIYVATVLTLHRTAFASATKRTAMPLPASSSPVLGDRKTSCSS
jgi:exopolysaccharide production protein ExoQ